MNNKSNTNVYDDIYFNCRECAKDTLEWMKRMISTYGYVTVAELYDSLDLTVPNGSTGLCWTWVNDAEIIYCSKRGYTINLPKPFKIANISENKNKEQHQPNPLVALDHIREAIEELISSGYHYDSDIVYWLRQAYEELEE